MSNKRDVDAKKFVWKNIITRFRIPYTLILNNGSNSIAKLSKDIMVSLVLRIGT